MGWRSHGDNWSQDHRFHSQILNMGPARQAAPRRIWFSPANGSPKLAIRDWPEDSLNRHDAEGGDFHLATRRALRWASAGLCTAMDVQLPGEE